MLTSLRPVACSGAEAAISVTRASISPTWSTIRCSASPVWPTSADALARPGGRGRDEGLDLLGRLGRALGQGADFGGRRPRSRWPASPARAASTPAFSASRLVWKAISSMTPMIWLICLDGVLDGAHGRDGLRARPGRMGGFVGRLQRDHFEGLPGAEAVRPDHGGQLFQVRRSLPAGTPSCLGAARQGVRGGDDLVGPGARTVRRGPAMTLMVSASWVMAALKRPSACGSHPGSQRGPRNVRSPLARCSEAPRRATTPPGRSRGRRRPALPWPALVGRHRFDLLLLGAHLVEEIWLSRKTFSERTVAPTRRSGSSSRVDRIVAFESFSVTPAMSPIDLRVVITAVMKKPSQRRPAG